MKDLTLVAINAKYIHTNLAVRYLRNALDDFEVDLYEGSINDSLHGILTHLLEINSLSYGFSCYIWNIELVLKIAELLKKAKPEALIIFGGPEVSFEVEQFLGNHTFVDAVIADEGELKLLALMQALRRQERPDLQGVFLKDRLDLEGVSKQISKSKQEGKETLKMEEIAFPYSESELNTLKKHIIYYETMRGCPYRCSYCLSSTKTGLVLRPLEMVFAEIDLFFKAGVKQVKLVDRTFNCKTDRAMAIFEYIINKAENWDSSESLPNFHFELTGDQISEQMIGLLRQAPKGLIQFEIGVQTTHLKTLEAIGRPIDFKKIQKKVKSLLNPGNIHIHLDLIAGLPFETYEIFKNSFNDVIDLKPDMLQLGFLKGLKGTRIRRDGQEHDYAFADFAPYEVVKNKYISAKELYELRNMETLLDRYYNSGDFKNTLNILLFENKQFEPFIFFQEFSRFWKKYGYFDLGISKERLYQLLNDYLVEQSLNFDQMLKDALAFDYIKNNQLKLPAFLETKGIEKEAVFEFLKDQDNIDKYLGEFSKRPAKKIFNQIRMVEFGPDFCQYLSKKDQAANQQETGMTKILFTAEKFCFV